MSFNLTTSGACIIKAGKGANAAIVISGATLSKWCDQAEGTLNASTRRDWVTDTASAGFSGILDDTVSDIVAMKIINYDMSGYTSRQEATTMLDVLRDNIVRNTEILQQERNKEVMT